MRPTRTAKRTSPARCWITRDRSHPHEDPAGICPNYQIHPAVPATGDHAAAGTGCPNHWVLEAGARLPVGQLTGFQTKNRNGGVDDPVSLDSTLLNAWDNSDAAP